MGTIHFVSDLESSALKALKDAEDCADIVNDLGRIYYTITHGSEQDARALDHELPVHVKVRAAVGSVHKTGLRSKGDFVDKRCDGFAGKGIRRKPGEDGIGLILYLL